MKCGLVLPGCIWLFLFEVDFITYLINDNYTPFKLNFSAYFLKDLILVFKIQCQEVQKIDHEVLHKHVYSLAFSPNYTENCKLQGCLLLGTTF